MGKFPALKRVITTTSRLPRHGEEEGVDYYFLPRDEFLKKVKIGDFAEYVEYGGNLYGTYKKELEQAINGDTLWKIDPSRAGEVREFLKRSFSPDVYGKLLDKVLVIYIVVSDDVVLQRLKKRDLSDTEIEKRMDDDAKIWNQYRNSYDFVVENETGKLDETIDKIVDVIDSQKS